MITMPKLVIKRTDGSIIKTVSKSLYQTYQETPEWFNYECKGKKSDPLCNNKRCKTCFLLSEASIDTYKNFDDPRNIKHIPKECSSRKCVIGRYICDHYNFKVFHLEKAKEWDYEKNENNPEEYSPNSNVQVWWKCQNNICKCHEWKTSINSRTNMNSDCPYCKIGKPCEHYNLKILYPEISEEWNYEKNEKNPGDYSPNSNMKVWWKCERDPCGCHVWEDTISNRTGINKNGCSYCNKSKPCKHNNFEIHCPEKAKEWDYTKNKGTPSDYSTGSHAKVWWICRNNICGCHRWQSVIRSRIKGDHGCPYCNSGKACSHYNFKIYYPEKAKDWDYSKNKGVPEDYSPNSNIEIWWKCQNDPCGCHVWLASINSRANMNSGCPYCNINKPCEHNNFKIYHPDMAKEWDNDKNEKRPEDYSSSSGIYVWWRCKNNHSWSAQIDHRTRKNTGCPICSNNGYSKIQITWLNSIIEKENIHIQHAENGGEYYIETIGKVDGYCEDTNTVYEFHGDYWHGNPKIYESEDYNERSRKTYGELYKNTLDREEKIKSLGYNLITIWECDYKDKMSV